MEDTTLDLQSLERFSYYMTFFEHAYKLKDQEIVSRKLKAPDFDDFRSIKKRVAQVLLKVLRSPEIFNFPQTFDVNGYRITLKGVSRWKKQEEELERYMRFIIELDVDRTNQDIIPTALVSNGRGKRRTKTHDMTIVVDENDRDLIFQNIIEKNSTDIAKFEEAVQYFKENYDIIFCSNSENDRSYIKNIIESNVVGSVHIPNDNISINSRDVRTNSLQEFIFSHVQSHGYNAHIQKLHIANMYKKVHLNITTDSEGRELQIIRPERHYYGRNNSLIPYKLYKINTFFNNLNDSNIYIPVNDGYGYYGRNDRQDGTMILARRLQNEDGEIRVVPNRINSTIRYDVRYSREALLNPDTFFDLSKMLASNIESKIKEGV
jgi:hypothetical protein